MKNHIRSLPFSGKAITAIMAPLALLFPFHAFGQDFTHPEGTLPDTGNFIDLAIGHVDLNGNEASYLSQHPFKKSLFGGIERFEYNSYIGDFTEFKAEGRALVENNDYLLNLRFLNEEVGYIKLGYKEKRFWYDGSGGYFPGSDTWIRLYDDELAIDRSKFHIIIGLTLPDMPEFELGYTQLRRDGLKSSTALADTSMTGGFGTRNIVPTFLDIDETRHILEFKASDRFANTKASLSLRSETADTNDARKISRRPGESSFRRITHREMFDSDLFSARATTITELSEKTTFTTGVAYTEMDVNATGSRIFGSDFDDPFDVDYQAQRRDHGWLNLLSDSQIDQWIINANLMTRPTKHLKAIYSLRFEEMYTDTFNSFDETEFSTSSNIHEIHEIELNGKSDWNDFAASADFVYTGKENVVYNGSILYSTGDGDQFEEEFEGDTGNQLLERLSNNGRDVFKVSIGAKFYPQTGIRYNIQAYHKEKDNTYDHIIDPTEPGGGNRFPAFTRGQDFKTDDINASVRWMASKRVSGLTRIDYQRSKIDSLGEGLEWSHSYDREAIILSQAVTVAFDKFYIQGNIIIADDKRESPVSSIGGGVANTVIVLPGDFWNANLSGNWSIDDISSCGVNLFYNRNDNYVDNSEFGQPYGEDATQRGASLTYTRKISDNAQITLRYTYYDYEDLAFGGFNDFDAQLLYSSIRYRF